MLYLYSQCKMNVNTGEPTDVLAPVVKKVVKCPDSLCNTVSDVIHRRYPAVFSAITEGLDRINSCAQSKAHTVSLKFTYM